jgi:hypothetical protein
MEVGSIHGDSSLEEEIILAEGDTGAATGDILDTSEHARPASDDNFYKTAMAYSLYAREYDMKAI